MKNAIMVNLEDLQNNDEKFRLDEVIQRIHIDKANGLIKIYRNYPFPTK